MLFLQYLLFPAALGLIGFIYNWQLEKVKRYELADKLVPKLSSDNPVEAYASLSMLKRIMDDDFYEDIAKLTATIQAQKITANPNVAKAQQAAAAAEGVSENAQAQLVSQVQKEVNQDVRAYESAQAPEGTTAGTAPADPVQPERVPPELQKRVALLSALKQKATEDSWIYLGATDRATGKWLTSYFQPVQGVSDPSQLAGRSIRLTQATYTRSTTPSREAAGTWVKGDVTGVIANGSEAPLEEVERVPGSANRWLWWAKLKR
jgi:hypothetical protein